MVIFLKELFKFLFFAMVVYIVMIFVWGEFAPSILRRNLSFKTNSTTRTKFTEISEFKDLDILFLGSSHSYRGFDVRIFSDHDLTTFNLGTSGQTNIQTEFLLEKYLDQLNAKIVVFEVNPLIFSGDGVESTLDIVSSLNIDKEIVSLGLSHAHINVINSMIYSALTEFVLGRKKESDKYNFEENVYWRGGFVQKDMSFFKNNAQRKEKKHEINSRQLESFKNILSLLAEKDIKVFLVQAPVTSSFYSSIENREEFDIIMANHGDLYVNFNGEIELSDSLHFYDHHHLNQDGVMIFNNNFLNLYEDTIKEWINRSN